MLKCSSETNAAFTFTDPQVYQHIAMVTDHTKALIWPLWP